MLKVIAGDFGSNVAASVQTTLTGQVKCLVVSGGLLNGSHKIPASDVESALIVTDENKVSMLGAISGGAIGAFLAGPIGMLAGSMLNGSTSAVTVLVSIRGGKKLLCVGANRDAVLLTAAAISDNPKTFRHPDEDKYTARKQKSMQKLLEDRDEDEAFGFLSE